MMRSSSGRPSSPDPTLARRLSRRGALQVGGVSLASALVGMGAVTSVRAQDATPAAATEAPFSPERQLALTQIVLSALAAASTPGALAGVWIPGEGSWTLAAGIGDLTAAAPLRIDDHVRIASITKTFVATVALQLVDEGTLSLDDRLGHFIPGIPNGDAITMRQLLNMTAGIYNYIEAPVIGVDYDRDPLLPFTPQQAVEIVRAHGQAEFPPGARSIYSDSNYILLGLILEQVTGHAIAAEITQRILDPLGLTQTSFPTSPAMPEPYAHGYAADRPGAPVRDVTRSNPAVAWASGAMLSTLEDLRRWVEILVAGSLLTPAMQAERLTIEPWSSEPVSMGYGLGIQEIGGLLGHTGGILGYGSVVMHDPPSGTTLAVVATLGNTQGSPAGGRIFAQIADLLFPHRGFAVLAPSSATPVP